MEVRGRRTGSSVNAVHLKIFRRMKRREGQQKGKIMVNIDLLISAVVVDVEVAVQVGVGVKARVEDAQIGEADVVEELLEEAGIEVEIVIKILPGAKRKGREIAFAQKKVKAVLGASAVSYAPFSDMN